MWSHRTLTDTLDFSGLYQNLETIEIFFQYKWLVQKQEPGNCHFSNLPQNFKEHTSYTPHIHLVRVVSVCEETFRGTVPSCRDIFCIWLLGVYTTT